MLAVRRPVKKGVRIGAKNPTKLAPFAVLAVARKFDVIATILLDADVDHHTWLLSSSSKSHHKGTLLLFQQQLPLHIVLKYKPPVRLVELLIQKLSTNSNREEGPSAVVAVAEATDMLGRSPLHVAVQHGCCVAVVELLLDHAAAAGPGIITRDYWGRSALHWAVSTNEQPTMMGGFGFCFGGSTAATSKLLDEMETRVKTVCALTQACPDMVYIRDEDGRTPFQLAIHCQADSALLYLLAAPNSNIINKTSTADHHEKVVQSEQTAATEDTAHNPLEMMVECKDHDDASSIGSGGISKFFGPARPAPVLPSILFIT